LSSCCRKAATAIFCDPWPRQCLQLLREAESESLIGAGRHERRAERLNYRNGYRDHNFETRLASLKLLSKPSRVSGNPRLAADPTGF
jgi:hypothetical protein